MLKPFYQGKLDAFCAVYAVINALRLTHSIRTLKARDILNDTLLSLSTDKTLFRKFLFQETDYVDLVDALLARQRDRMPLEVSRPFAGNPNPGVDEVWDALADWLGDGGANKNRAAIFRFLRYVKPGEKPLNRHWTTADYVKDDILHLFDCSHEAEAILNIRKDGFAVSRDAVDPQHLLYIQPETVRFLRLPF